MCPSTFNFSFLNLLIEIIKKYKKVNKVKVNEI